MAEPTKQRREISSETRMMKALSHPLRQRLLERLAEKAASPSVLAAELGEPLGNVSYHVKILLEFDAVELVETRPVRGALEHIYRATAKPLSWNSLVLDERGRDEVMAVLAEAVDRCRAIEAESAARIAKDGSSATRRTDVALLHFDRAETT